MPDWVIWSIVAVLLGVGELLTPGMFFLGPVALAAVAAAVVGALGVGVIVQLLVFVVLAIASVGVLRPIARSHLRMPPELRTGSDALVGAKALVVRRVDSNGGLVKIGGEEWTARTFFEEQVLEPGTRVEVAKIEGATALVYE